MPQVLEILKTINKEYKNDSLVKVGCKIIDYDAIKFSSPTANYPLFKGIPKGRIIEISGLEGSGKTSLASDLIAQAQKEEPDKKCIFIDVEHTYDFTWAKRLGVNIEDLIYVDPQGMSGEDLLTLVVKLAEAEDVSLIVLDSYAALTTQEEWEEKDIATQAFKSMAKPIGKFLRIINQLIPKTGAIFCGINQLRMNLGPDSKYHPYLEPCGKAIDFYNSVLIRFGTKKFINEDGDEVTDNAPNKAGVKLRFKVIKNKVCINNRNSGYLTVRFRNGVDIVADTLAMAELFNLVKKGGAWYNLIDLETGEYLMNEDKLLKLQGAANVRKYLNSNPNYFYKLRDKVNEVISVWEDDKEPPKLEEVDVVNDEQIIG